MSKLCKYGCNQEAKFTLKNGSPCCSDSYNKCPELRKKNANGQIKRHAEGRGGYKFTKSDIKKSNEEAIKQSIEKAFVENSTYSNEFIKPKFIEYYLDGGYKCNECAISEWNNKPIILELDHIDGDNRNNLVSNLRLLCPNCHSQTDTFRGRNMNNGFKKVEDNVIIEAYKENGNIRQTLLAVGLSPRGANYQRVKKLIGN